MNDMTAVIRQCQRHGLLYVQGKKHGRLVDPVTRRSIPVSTTPSCRHAHRAVLRYVRKYLGVEISTP